MPTPSSDPAHPWCEPLILKKELAQTEWFTLYDRDPRDPVPLPDPEPFGRFVPQGMPDGEVVAFIGAVGPNGFVPMKAYIADGSSFVEYDLVNGTPLIARRSNGSVPLMRPAYNAEEMGKKLLAARAQGCKVIVGGRWGYKAYAPEGEPLWCEPEHPELQMCKVWPPTVQTVRSIEPLPSGDVRIRFNEEVPRELAFD